MLFTIITLIFGTSLVTTAFGNNEDAYARLESRLNYMENQITRLNKQVSQQYDSMEEMRSELRQKNTELEHLYDVQRQHVPFSLSKAAKGANKRFLLGNDSVNIAFFARFDHQTDLTGIAKQQTIIFDTVVINEGSAFSQATGEFTVPAAGLYLISVAITSDLGHSHEIEVGIMKNNDIVARAHAHGDSGHLDQGGVTIVDEFNAEDKISVRSLSDSGAALYGLGLTTFSGVRIN